MAIGVDVVEDDEADVLEVEPVNVDVVEVEEEVVDDLEVELVVGKNAMVVEGDVDLEVEVRVVEVGLLVDVAAKESPLLECSS